MRPVELSPPDAAAKDRPNRAKGGRFTRNPSSRQIKLTVATRQQSPQEARQFSAAFDLLVGEIVRRELLGREQERKP